MAIIDEVKDPKAQLTVNIHAMKLQQVNRITTIVRWMNDLHPFIHNSECTSRGWMARASFMVPRDTQLLKEIEKHAITLNIIFSVTYYLEYYAMLYIFTAHLIFYQQMLNW